MMLFGQILTLIVLSGVTGAALTQHYQIIKHRTHVNTSLFLAAAPTSREQGSDSVIATHEEKIIELKEENQASRDDRRLIHDQVAKIAETENNHYNALNDRLNVDEAKVTTVLWVVGFIFTLTQGVLLFFNITDRMDRTRSERREDVREART